MVLSIVTAEAGAKESYSRERMDYGFKECMEVPARQNLGPGFLLQHRSHQIACDSFAGSSHGTLSMMLVLASLASHAWRFCMSRALRQHGWKPFVHEALRHKESWDLVLTNDDECSARAHVHDAPHPKSSPEARFHNTMRPKSPPSYDEFVVRI
eukprot:3422367-Amphidinium_carterae.1